MSDKFQVTASRATAIAIANALVRHLKLGQFMVEFEVRDYMLRESKLGDTVKACVVEGRSNIGRWVTVTANLVYKPVGDYQYPFSQLVARLQTSSEIFPHYECDIAECGITFKQYRS